MSKKRIFLITALVILIAATVIILISSFLKKSPASDVYAPDETNMVFEEKEAPQTVLEPLPTDNKEAIDAEMMNIDKEINSAIDTGLDDLSDIETSL